MSEMTAARTLRIIAVAAVAAAWVVAVPLLWRTAVPAGLELPDLRAAELFDGDMLAETGRYAGVLRALWLGAAAAQVAVLAAVALAAPALVRRLRGGAIARGLGALLVALAALWLAGLPFGVAAHWWRRRHETTTLGYVDWLLVPWLGLLVTVALACAAVVTGMLLARRYGSRWWLPGAPLLALAGAATVLVQPLVFAPRFGPLEDRVLERRIETLAAELGVPGIEVRVRRIEDRTRRANASLHGVGPTRRLILWDTLLDGRFDRAEVTFVAAHELAHASRDHLWKGLAWFVLATPLLTAALAYGTRPRGGLARPEAVPLAVLVAVVLQLATLPLANVLSRRYEAEADWVALEATRTPDAAESFFRRLPETNLAQPEGPAAARVLLATHPSLVRRIAMARAWPGPGDARDRDRPVPEVRRSR